MLQLSVYITYLHYTTCMQYPIHVHMSRDTFVGTWDSLRRYLQHRSLPQRRYKHIQNFRAIVEIENGQERHTVSTKTHLQLPRLISKIFHFRITTSRSILDFIRNLTIVINPEISPKILHFDVARIWPSCQILMLLKPAYHIRQ